MDSTGCSSRSVSRRLLCGERPGLDRNRDLDRATKEPAKLSAKKQTRRSKITPYEAIRSGTVNVAKYLEDDQTGTLEVGKNADFILVEGNPLSNIENA